MPYVDPVPELKRELGAELALLVTRFNGDDAGALLETDRSRISDLRRGQLKRFSLETLVRYLARLECRVELHVTGPRFNHRRRS